jgi:putative ABC transport system permease protein
MRPANVLHLYRVRLRARALQELFAVAGIAAGVALLLAAQVSSSSLESSVSRLSRGIVGHATLQLAGRGPEGFAQGTVSRVRHLKGVKVAAPLLEVDATAGGPHGSQSVVMLGADESMSALGGVLERNPELTPVSGFETVVLPAQLAQQIGVHKFGQQIDLKVAGKRRQAALYALLHKRQIGALVSSPLALASLSYLQEMSGLEGRISRILIQPKPGQEAGVRTELEALAAGRLNVEPVDYDEKLFQQAATASSQSTSLFAVIGMLIGFLFAFNATLFTVPQRRRLAAELQRDGYRRKTVTLVLLVDALVLGVVASALGLGLGDLLSSHLFHSNTAFLSLAFTFGAERSVGWHAVTVAAAGGMLAAVAAVLLPLRDLFSRDPLAIVAPRERFAERPVPAVGAQAVVGIACLIGASAILKAAPDDAVPGVTLLVLSLLLVLPAVLLGALALLRRVAGAITSAVPHIAAMELGASSVRSTAIVATGAIAIFGSVTIQGSHDDLLSGLARSTNEANAPGAVWVAPAGSYDLLHTASFSPANLEAKLRRLPMVRAVRVYRGGLFDYGGRRTMVLAPPAALGKQLAEGQLQQGRASALQGSGWVAMSPALAREHHLHVGQRFTLPASEPRSFRLAALTSNFGWAPGTILMSAEDYASAWHTTAASALEVLPVAGVSPGRAASAVRAALGSHTGLAVQTAAQHASREQSLNRGALSRLAQIAAIIPIAALLAMAAAMGAMVWQRRPRLARLKLDGLAHAVLWRTVLLESALLLGVGCLVGAVFGVYGRDLADRALRETIDFPVAHTVVSPSGFGTAALLVLVGIAIVALPGYMAAGVPAALALQDQ